MRHLHAHKHMHSHTCVLHMCVRTYVRVYFGILHLSSIHFIHYMPHSVAVSQHKLLKSSEGKKPWNGSNVFNVKMTFAYMWGGKTFSNSYTLLNGFIFVTIHIFILILFLCLWVSKANQYIISIWLYKIAKCATNSLRTFCLNPRLNVWWQIYIHHNIHLLYKEFPGDFLRSWRAYLTS